LRLNVEGVHDLERGKVDVAGGAQAGRTHVDDAPRREFPPLDDGTQLFGLLQNYEKWELRERAAGEPLIWHDTPWRDGTKEYRGHNEILVEMAFGGSSTRISPISRTRCGLVKIDAKAVAHGHGAGPPVAHRVG
jgi:hypothetical protein